jgi:Ca2+-binding RTX toxin-like protein
VNRLGEDSIQVLDPQLGFITPTNGVLSVGNGTDAWDIVFVNTNKAYVSRLASPKLLIINPTTLQITGTIDLSSLVKPTDSDGSPGPAYMLMPKDLPSPRVYLALQHQGAPGEVVVIDPTTDEIVTVITLNGQNPISEFQFNSILNRILISSVGDFAVNDGGIEAINPDTNTVDPQFAVTEATMGGDIIAFVIVSRTKGFAIVSDATFANSLITFDPSSGERLNSLVGPLNVIMAHLALNSRNEVYLAIIDTQIATSGLRIFDAVTDNEITTMPLNVGQFPPVFTVFVE